MNVIKRARRGDVRDRVGHELHEREREDGGAGAAGETARDA